MEYINQFHLAIPVKNLEESRIFYRDILGAKEGRSTSNHVDLNFYNHHLVIHQPQEPNPHLYSNFESKFHGEMVLVPHFGVNLDRNSWLELADRIKSHSYEFYDPPHTRMSGLPGEHATMFILDPSGNAMEFKAFKNHNEVFSTIFDPESSDSEDLNSLIEKALEAKI